ncbi:MAG: hypothetical protein WD512_15440 [Candidatus Paceibacterota bacterium]
MNINRFIDILNNLNIAVTSSKKSSIVENKCKSDENKETDIIEYKKDFFEMSVGSLKAIMQHSQNILSALDDPNIKENLTESWLQGKIAITEDYMRTIHDFVMFVESNDEESEGNSKPGLWDNIRKKKQREGENYRPTKPGDKDRPDPEQWKKLTKETKKK